MRTTPPAYLRSVAWSLNELDAFEAAALRLKARLLPGQPDYARLRLARDAARVAAGRAPAWPLIEDDDAAAHAAMLKLAEVADAPGARKMLMEKGGSRLAAFRCAATGRTCSTGLRPAPARDDTASAEDDGSADGAWDADAVRFADALLAHGADPGAADDAARRPSTWPPRATASTRRRLARVGLISRRARPHAAALRRDGPADDDAPVAAAHAGAARGRHGSLERATGAATECATELLPKPADGARQGGATPLALAARAPPRTRGRLATRRFVRRPTTRCPGTRRRAPRRPAATVPWLCCLILAGAGLGYINGCLLC